MNDKIPVTVLGATGMVGQNYLKLLNDHPWFEIVDVAASPNSAGKSYSEAVADRWHMSTDIPSGVRDLKVRDVNDIEGVKGRVKCAFSAISMPDKPDVIELEFSYAAEGFAVVSNNSANRWTEDVPMLIPEINPDHTDVIALQQSNRSLPKTGFVAVKPNCSIQSYLITLVALERAGYPVERIQVSTLQALSGAGYAGISSKEMIDNVIPFIPGEEEKTESEPLKILGEVTEKGISVTDRLNISATCTRVPIVDGHMAIVHIGFKEKAPDLNTVKSVWRDFKADPSVSGLPSSPEKPIIYLEEVDRPQTKLDMNAGKGMSVTVGRLAEDKFFDFRYVALSHNTIRGAAGGAILTAELLVKKGFIGG